MKLLICGSRAITDYKLLLEALKESCFEPISLISGGATGVDTLAERFAAENNLPIEIFRPDYARWGRRRAPLVRDADMVIASDACLALWDGSSRGTRFTFECARRKKKPVYVKTVSEEKAAKG